MMLTRCPACTTTFRLTPEQVKARQGQVRCGRCQHVFNAIEFLVEPEPVNIKPASAPAATPSAEPETASANDAALDLDVSSPPEVVETVQQEPEPASVVAPLIEDDEIEPVQTDTGRSKPGLDSVLLQPLPKLSPLSDAYLRATEASRTPRWPWVLGSLLAATALTVQMLITFRVELAAQRPGLRPALESLCGYFDCVVGLPSDPNQVSIEASDLHPSPQNKGKLELTATLKNRAPYAQTWPTLEVTLTDGADKPIVRKIIPPEQFLPVGQDLAAGFPASGDLTLQLTMDAGDLPAAGYRLYLFYP
jgi:predicted Zn finger-like uncharacterized protein